MILLPLLVAQAAPAPVAASAAPASVSATTPARFSILVPVADEPCVPARTDKADPDGKDDIVVCGRPLPSQKVPYAEQVIPDHPVPSNPYLRGTGALAAEATPCGAVQAGCTGAGFNLLGAGAAMVRLVQKAVAPDSCCERPGEGTSFGMLVTDAAKGVGRAFRKKPDKSNRVPISLDDTPQTRTILP